MTDDLFPNVARGGSSWDMDADAFDHRQKAASKPDQLTVTDDVEVGRLYGPDGKRFRTVREGRSRVTFGFHP